MQTGAVIQEGLKDWQILQQENGTGSIHLSGYFGNHNYKHATVFVRIVKEDSGEDVIAWKKADTVKDGQWEIWLENIPAGGLYRLETCLDESEALTHQWATRGDMVHFWGIGDLYVIAGQSNSAGYGKDRIQDPPELGVHLFANDNQWKLASHPMNDSTNTKHAINGEDSNSGNSPYLSFAKYLKKEMHYPIGLIQTALGGSPLSRWNPNQEGDLYENMVHIIGLAGGKVKGILWFQGCSDTSDEQSKTYLKRFQQMVEALRNELDDKELPFLTVQLSRFTSVAEGMEEKGWTILRESQRRAAHEIKNVYVVPSIDLGLSDCIHISAGSHLILGERLAKSALKNIYGWKVSGDAPDPVNAIRIDEQTIEISFSNVSEQLYAYDVSADKLSFRIEDENGFIAISDYQVKNGNTYILQMERPMKGEVFIHNAFGMHPREEVPVDFGTHLPVLAFYRYPVM